MKSTSLKFTLYKCLSVLLIFAAPLAAQSKKDKERAKKLQDQADKAFQQRNFRDAILGYEQSLAIVATNSYSHYWKGSAHYYRKQESDKLIAKLTIDRSKETDSSRQRAIDEQIGQLKLANEQDLVQAGNEYTLALNQGFKPIEVYKIRYFVYFEQKNYDAALADIQAALKIAPNELAYLKARGEVNYQRKAYPEALEAFKQVIKVAPNDADTYYNMALIYFANGDVSAQKTSADTALAKGTRYPGEAFYLLGDACQKTKDATGAINAYRKAINSKPDIFQAYRNLGEVFRSENRFLDAIAVLKQALLVFPNDGNIYTDLSWYYSLADRPDDAVQAAKAGITLLPNQYTAYTNLCRAYNDLKNYEQAIAACTSALRLAPGDGETSYYLGNALVGQGRSADATRRYSDAVSGLVLYTRNNPDSSDSWYLLGNAYFADKQYDKAIESYLKCLSLSPKFLRARVNLGFSYTRKKNKAAATEQYNILLAADPALAARLKTAIDGM